MLQTFELPQLNAVLEHIETTQSLSVLLVQQEQFLMMNGHSVVNFNTALIFAFSTIYFKLAEITNGNELKNSKYGQNTGKM